MGDGRWEILDTSPCGDASLRLRSLQVLDFGLKISLFTIHYSLFTIPYSLSPIPYPLSPKA